ncbi:hypothetical protein [Couchioplanes azureus]|uniref:hypothetical protein n=1 Tax=Couchioplanes caeruleus TaxID=56438 RepID=UPI001670469D|nr:hypothetical protein [Couchioplanes caeruleus]
MGDLTTPSSADGIVTADVWLTLDGVAFPENRWNDFSIAVLSSATTAYEEIAHGAPDAFSYFFDGPFYLYYRRIAGGLVAVEANTDKGGVPKTLAAGDIEIEPWRTTLLAATEATLEAMSGKPHTEEPHDIMQRIKEVLQAPPGAARRPPADD